jgi:hypothetical protein
VDPIEIGQIWAEHYPNRRTDRGSRQVCRLICYLLRELARSDIGGGNSLARLARVLGAAGIPMEQFDVCEAEAVRSSAGRTAGILL